MSARSYTRRQLMAKAPVPLFVRLTLTDDSVVELNGSGVLTSGIMSPYLSTVVIVETGAKCSGFAGALFRGTAPNLETVILSKNITEISDRCFNGCRKLKTINTENILSYGAEAFMACGQLSSITFAEGVTSLPSQLFRGTALKNPVIPSTVTSIGDGVFRILTSNTTATCLPTTPPTLANTNAFGSVTKIYVPAESVEAYKTASVWSGIASKINPIP